MALHDCICIIKAVVAFLLPFNLTLLISKLNIITKILLHVAFRHSQDLVTCIRNYNINLYIGDLLNNNRKRLLSH